MTEAVAVRIPKMSMAVDEAVLARWLVEDGAAVAPGQPLYLIETDKVETEIEAVAGGVVHLIGEPGCTYEAGTLVATITPDEP